MSASALLARLKEAGVAVEAEGGDLRLKGPKAALGNQVLTELRANKAELLDTLKTLPAPVRSHEGMIAEWRAAIVSVETNQIDIAKLKTVSLRFLDSPDAFAAVSCGWDAVNLFGVHRGLAPHERLDAWGLVPAQVWGVHRYSIVNFERDACLLRTRRGATLCQPRLRANFDQAVPWWMHQRIASRIDEKGGDRSDLTFEVEERAAIIADGCGASQAEAIERAAREYGFASAGKFHEATKRKPANPWE
jgi:TubC N-terminal docking domain